MTKPFITGHNNYVGSGTDRIVVLNGRDNTVHPGASGIVLISCSGMITTPDNNEKVYFKNFLVVSPEYTTATGSAPTTVDGSYSLYYCDDSGGSVTINLGSPVLLKNCRITFLRKTAGGHNITFNAYAAENLNGSALPQNKIPTQWDKMTITSDGTDWYIVS